MVLVILGHQQGALRCSRFHSHHGHLRLWECFELLFGFSNVFFPDLFEQLFHQFESPGR
jgi:hypothetical protein